MQIQNYRIFNLKCLKTRSFLTCQIQTPNTTPLRMHEIEIVSAYKSQTCSTDFEIQQTRTNFKIYVFWNFEMQKNRMFQKNPWVWLFFDSIFVVSCKLIIFLIRQIQISCTWLFIWLFFGILGFANLIIFLIISEIYDFRA